ncbi:hypothetical protein [Pimelobacter simplex]|uniref:hypothetical protein n=1 Tax=Nocardioides simplex TaxID=2045 RepID=UPI00214F776F|nr:hypothetical protein [Pimelobacter simplex]UUW88425.1 hypothetical protein M0M43_22160 [Pimelobacter simplex]UUW97929.1 hypothetical protein M0M48_10805 [Pimelobacter simplex]
MSRRSLMALIAGTVLAIVVTASIALALTGRDSDDDPRAEDLPTSGDTADPTDAPTTPTGPPSFKVGETMTAQEVTLTVSKVEAVDLGRQGSPGFRETVESFVRVCTPDDALTPWEADTLDFVAVTRDGLVIPVDTTLSGVRSPLLPYGPVPAGRCVQGWVQIGMDSGQARTVTAVEFQPNAGETAATWTLSRSLRLGRPDYLG